MPWVQTLGSKGTSGAEALDLHLLERAPSESDAQPGLGGQGGEWILTSFKLRFPLPQMPTCTERLPPTSGHLVWSLRPCGCQLRGSCCLKLRVEPLPAGIQGLEGISVKGSVIMNNPY